MNVNYSIWLIPEENSKEMRELEETIGELSEEYHTPNFTPHVTLVGSIEKDLSSLKDAVSSVIENHSSVNVELQKTRFSTTKHQCNYLMVEPTADLLKLQDELREKLDEPEEMYVPHLSLIYSDMNISEREKLDELLDSLSCDFSSGRLAIFDTSGTEEDWDQVAEFRLEEA